MTNEILTTLHPDHDPDTNLYPNIKKGNIPDKSIDINKLSDGVKSLLDSINELHPSGTDTSTNILAYTTNKGIYIGIDTGHWYYWDGTQYVDGGVYQATQIQDGEIENSKLKETYVIGKIGKNKFNKNCNIIIGSYLRPSDGGISSNADYFYQDYFIPIEPDISYSLSSFTNVSTGVFIIFYTNEKTFISGLNRFNNSTFTTPANAYYCRISAPNSIINNIQLEKGNITQYETYKQINLDNSINFDMLQGALKTLNEGLIIELGKKYYTTPSETTIQYNAGYLLKTDGTIEGGYNTTEWKVSDYIDVSNGAYIETIAFRTNAGVCLYDENYNLLKYYDNATSTAQIRDINVNIINGEGKYIRVQWYLYNTPTIKIFNDLSDNINALINNTNPLVIVDANGNGDYTDIQNALDNVNDSISNPITIIVMPGTYNHFHTWKTKATRNVVRYINIIGIDRDSCIVDDTLNSTFEANGTLANMTLISNSTLPTGYSEDEYDSLFGYALHIDYVPSTTKVVDNCKLISYKGATLGMGLHSDETITIKNCEIYRYESDNVVSHDGAYVGLFVHNSATSSLTQKFNLYNCIIKSDYDYSIYIVCSYNYGLMSVDMINNVLWSVNNNLSCIQTTSGNKLSGDYIELSLSSFGNSNSRLNNTIGD